MLQMIPMLDLSSTIGWWRWRQTCHLSLTECGIPSTPSAVFSTNPAQVSCGTHTTPTMTRVPLHPLAPLGRMTSCLWDMTVLDDLSAVSGADTTAHDHHHARCLPRLPTSCLVRRSIHRRHLQALALEFCLTTDISNRFLARARFEQLRLVSPRTLTGSRGSRAHQRPVSGSHNPGHACSVVVCLGLDQCTPRQVAAEVAVVDMLSLHRLDSYRVLGLCFSFPRILLLLLYLPFLIPVALALVS